MFLDFRMRIFVENDRMGHGKNPPPTPFPIIMEVENDSPPPQKKNRKLNLGETPILVAHRVIGVTTLHIREMVG